MSTRILRHFFSTGLGTAPARAEEFIEYIEREFQLMKTRADRRLLLEIGNSYFRILR